MLHHYFLARLVVGSYSSLRLPAPLALLSRPLSSILLFKCVCSSSPVQIARFCLLLTCRPSPSNPRRADDAFSRSFPSGVSHEGLETLFSRLQRKCLFTRQQALSIIDTLRSVETAEAEAGDEEEGVQVPPCGRVSIMITLSGAPDLAFAPQQPSPENLTTPGVAPAVGPAVHCAFKFSM